MNRPITDLETAKPKRRRLKFGTLAEVMPEVERLLGGHEVAGQWSLGLICHHVRLGIELSMDGFLVRASRLVRRTVGPVAGWFSLGLGWIPRGIPAPGWKPPADEFEAPREAENLRAAIARFASFDGRFDEHPMMGRFSRAKWERFHCVHCAHHLNFAILSNTGAIG